MDPTVVCADDSTMLMQAIGICIFLLWCIVPFVVLSVQLIRYKWKGTLEEQMKKSESFRIMYGWAFVKYRSDSKVAFLWEIVNAAIKVIMVGAAELMYEDNRRLTQGILIGTSLVLHVIVMPYKTKTSNYTLLVIVFCVVDLGEFFFSLV